jgi:hypothetical protein
MPVLAAHEVVEAPLARSSAVSGGHGLQVSNTTIDWQLGSNVAHAPLSPTQSGVAAWSDDSFAGLTFGGTSQASASLATGRLKAGVHGYGPNVFGNHFGLADALIADTIFFTNTSGGNLAVTLRLSFNGSIFDPNGNATPEAYTRLAFACPAGPCANDVGTSIRFQGTGEAVYGDIYSTMNEAGLLAFSSNIGAGTLFDRFDVWQQDPYGSGGYSNGWVQARLLVPTGTTSLGISARLWLDCRGGSICDFGHTGALGFVGALPDGLTIGSASGVFLSAAGGGGAGGVPEPATWAMLIAGFGLVGAAARRRRRAVALA